MLSRLQLLAAPRSDLHCSAHCYPVIKRHAFPCCREENYNLIPVLVAGSSGRVGGTEETQWVQRFISMWFEVKDDSSLADKFGPIINAATDGDPKRRRGYNREFNSTTLALDSPLRARLEDMPFMDLRVGEHEVTSTFDARHIVKRLRTTIINLDRGIRISTPHPGPRLPALQLKEFMAANGCANVNEIFQPADKQNVPAAVKLLKGLAALREFSIAPTSQQPYRPIFNATQKRWLAEAQVLGEIAHRLLSPWQRLDTDLDQILKESATVSMLLMFLWEKNRGDFIPSQLYHDLQSSIKDMFFFVARLQAAEELLQVMVTANGSTSVAGSSYTQIFSNVLPQGVTFYSFTVAGGQQRHVRSARLRLPARHRQPRALLWRHAVPIPEQELYLSGFYQADCCRTANSRHLHAPPRLGPRPPPLGQHRGPRQPQVLARRSESQWGESARCLAPRHAGVQTCA